MAKLFVKLNVRLSTLLHTKLKEKNNEYYSDDHQQQKKITTIHYRKNEMKNKTNLKTKIKKKIQKCECVTKSSSGQDLMNQLYFSQKWLAIIMDFSTKFMRCVL